MNKLLNIKNIRIILGQGQKQEENLNIHFKNQIQNIGGLDLNWNQMCLRWQSEDHITYIPGKYVQLMIQIFTNKRKKQIKLLGSCKISLLTRQEFAFKQHKMALLNNGEFVGWLYYFVLHENDEIDSNKYIYIHKMHLQKIQQDNYPLSLQIMHNNITIYKKQIKFYQINKSIYPNIKINYQLSDMLIFQLRLTHINTKPFKLRVQNLERGHSSECIMYFQNDKDRRIGTVIMNLFIDNIFFKNQKSLKNIRYKTNVSQTVLKKIKTSESSEFSFTSLNKSKLQLQLIEKRQIQYQKLVKNRLKQKRNLINKYLFRKKSNNYIKTDLLQNKLKQQLIPIQFSDK